MDTGDGSPARRRLGAHRNQARPPGIVAGRQAGGQSPSSGLVPIPGAAAPVVLRAERGGRRGPRVLALASSLAGLVGVPLAVGWLVDDRPGIGPVLVTLSPTHGVHAFDLVVLAVALPTWIGFAVRTRCWLRRWRRRRRRVA